jgi:hypothetical protein
LDCGSLLPLWVRSLLRTACATAPAGWQRKAAAGCTQSKLHICKFLAYWPREHQFSGVRGSPLLRFLILVVALATTAAGLVRVTSTKNDIAVSTPVPEARKEGSPPVPYRLLLSAPAESVTIDTGVVSLANQLSGTLELDPANPRVGLIVQWKNPAAPGEHRFAKLTLEPPGQTTLTHVFDADGDIDDIFELPLPAENHE